MEATVEVLTAEVRTLMVGSRQVTLSVYKQLDEFDLWADDPADFEPFGRVRSGAKFSDYDSHGKESMLPPAIEFVGRRTTDGALVRAAVMWSDYRAIDEQTKQTLHEWGKLPLIVLAGLR